jgi:hypothetical protein
MELKDLISQDNISFIHQHEKPILSPKDLEIFINLATTKLNQRGCEHHS